jgi:hypothetical protein
MDAVKLTRIKYDKTKNESNVTRQIAQDEGSLWFRQSEWCCMPPTSGSMQDSIRAKTTRMIIFLMRLKSVPPS